MPQPLRHAISRTHVRRGGRCFREQLRATCWRVGRRVRWMPREHVFFFWFAGFFQIVALGRIVRIRRS
jgi:hypothetical protein